MDELLFTYSAANANFMATWLLTLSQPSSFLDLRTVAELRLQQMLSLVLLVHFGYASHQTTSFHQHGRCST